MSSMMTPPWIHSTADYLLDGRRQLLAMAMAAHKENGDDRELFTRRLAELDEAISGLRPRRLEEIIRAQHHALAKRLSHPGSTGESLRMEYDRLAGMIEAHHIVGGGGHNSRALVNQHAHDWFGIDMPALVTKITTKGT